MKCLCLVTNVINVVSYVIEACKSASRLSAPQTPFEGGLHLEQQSFHCRNRWFRSGQDTMDTRSLPALRNGRSKTPTIFETD